MTFMTRNVEKIAGIFIIAVFVSAIFLTLFIAKEQEWFAKKYILKAVFDHGGDIAPGTVVSMEGIDIGKVYNIYFNVQNKIEVKLSIKERFKKQIRKDSCAAIIRQNLFGTPTLDVSLGSPNAPVLEEGDYIDVKDIKEMTMRDVVMVSNNLVQVLKDVVDPAGPYQKIARNLEKITSKMDLDQSSAVAMLSDGGKMYRESYALLEAINNHMKTSKGMPIELTEKSQLILNLNQKLDKQLDIAIELAKKLDVISERVVSNQGMAGAVVSDKELYYEMLKFMRESKLLLDALNQLANELKIVLPKLPGLIDTANAGMKDVQDVMGSIKRFPFIKEGIRESKPPQPLELEGRIERRQK